MHITTIKHRENGDKDTKDKLFVLLYAPKTKMERQKTNCGRQVRLKLLTELRTCTFQMTGGGGEQQMFLTHMTGFVSGTEFPGQRPSW